MAILYKSHTFASDAACVETEVILEKTVVLERGESIIVQFSTRCADGNGLIMVIWCPAACKLSMMASLKLKQLLNSNGNIARMRAALVIVNKPKSSHRIIILTGNISGIIPNV